MLDWDFALDLVHADGAYERARAGLRMEDENGTKESGSVCASER